MQEFCGNRTLSHLDLALEFKWEGKDLEATLCGPATTISLGNDFFKIGHLMFKQSAAFAIPLNPNISWMDQ